MTVTGSQYIQKTLGNSVFHVYVPYDFPGAVKRFLKRTQPKLAIMIGNRSLARIYCTHASALTFR